MILACLWFGCETTPAPAFRPPATTLSDCDLEASPQLRTLCLVQLAADLGGKGDTTGAQAACASVAAPLWNAECHFRAGEELSKTGLLAEGLPFCQNAAKYRTFCFTHSVWGAPPGEAPLQEWVALGAGWEDVDGVESLRARWWFNHYFGTGIADSSAAKAASGDDGPHARGAWALEAVRLAGGDLAAARTSWDGAPLAGAPLAPPERLGRYDLPFAIAEEKALPHVPTFGGGQRLVGETPEEDLDIALLEAAYFRESAGSATFAPWLADVRARVRYTALRCYRTLPSPDAEAVLTALKDDPDPIARAHVADALKYKTWRGKGNLPGLKQARPPER